jgi:hypothetical protein
MDNQKFYAKNFLIDAGSSFKFILLKIKKIIFFIRYKIDSYLIYGIHLLESN